MPFTIEQFLNVFRSYNEAVWPAQIIAYVLAGIAVWLALVRHPAVFLILAVFWLWNGAVYHWAFFAPVNPAARAFAAIFVAQGVLFLLAMSRHREAFSRKADPAVGIAAVVYAAVFYPLLGEVQGHGYPYNPAFGLAPCPTTIFTLGILMIVSAPKHLYLIPILWAAIGSLGALNFGILEDLGMPLFALLAVWSMIPKRAATKVRRGSTAAGSLR